MIGPKKSSIPEMPTDKLVVVGLALLVMVPAMVLIPLRIGWSAWKQGERTIAFIAVGVAILFGSWGMIIAKIGQELSRRHKNR